MITADFTKITVSVKLVCAAPQPNQPTAKISQSTRQPASLLGVCFCRIYEPML
jgi:hypothetical protein